MIGHIEVYVSTWCNEHIIADSYFTNDNCIYSNPHGIADDGNAFELSAVGLSDGNSRGNIAIPSDDCFLIDDDRSKMTNIETFTYLRIIWYLYSKATTASPQQQ